MNFKKAYHYLELFPSDKESQNGDPSTLEKVPEIAGRLSSSELTKYPIDQSLLEEKKAEDAIEESIQTINYTADVSLAIRTKVSAVKSVQKMDEMALNEENESQEDKIEPPIRDLTALNNTGAFRVPNSELTKEELEERYKNIHLVQILVTQFFLIFVVDRNGRSRSCVFSLFRWNSFRW